MGHETAQRSSTRRAFQDALERLDPDQPQLFYFHMMGPHGPYTPSAESRRVLGVAPESVVASRQRSRDSAAWYRHDTPEEITGLRALYDAEIRDEDAILGWFIDRLRARGMVENALIVFLSDHGEAFDEHGRMEHGNNLFHEEIHVPLILHGPGVPVARRSEVVGLHDVAPTVIRYAGLEPPSTMEGANLLHLPPDGRAISLREFAEVPEDTEWFGVIAEGSKALWIPDRATRLLYRTWNQETDPADPAAAEAFIQAHGEGTRVTHAATTTLDDATREELLELGYLH